MEHLEKCAFMIKTTVYILNYHTYDTSFSMDKIGNGGRSKAKPLTNAMKKKYKKYFKGVK